MDINSLLNNNSILQYMSGIGAALSEGKSPATAMNQITQQQIGAQSKVKMQNNYLAQLKDVIGGGEAATSVKKPGKGSSFKMNPDGSITMNIGPEQVANSRDLASILPHALAGGLPEGQDVNSIAQAPVNEAPIAEFPLVPTSVPQVGAPLKSPVGGATLEGERMTQAQRQAMMSALSGDPTLNSGTYGVLAKDMLNPSTRPLSINGADLAGLSSADVSQALHDTVGVETARQHSLTNAGNLLYQGAEAFAKTNPKADPESQLYPIPVYGQGQVTGRQWKELPTNIKEYSAYQYLQKQTNPNEPVASFKEFQDFGKEHRSQFLKMLQEDPSLMATEMALKAAGASKTEVNVGEKAKAQVLGHKEGELLSPDYHTSIEKQVRTNGEYKVIRDRLQTEHPNTDPRIVKEAAIQEKVRSMLHSQLKAKFGSITYKNGVGWFDANGDLIKGDPYAD